MAEPGGPMTGADGGAGVNRSGAKSVPPHPSPGAGTVGPRLAYDRDADLERLVDALERAPNFAQNASRRLLVARVERYAEGRLFVPEHDIARNWFTELVNTLDETPGGLAALARAVTMLASKSRLADTVTVLATRLTAAPVPAGPVPAAPAPADAGDTLAGHAPAALPPSGPAGAAASPMPNGASPGSSAGPPEEPRDLTEVELAELARLFVEPADAIRVLVDAGVPRVRVPAWGTRDPDGYWYDIAVRLRDGLLMDGRRRVLAAALQRYPGNWIFLGLEPPLG
ncbi:effector-associated domain 2-containing protein [Pseudofrankia asymbiotica]|uniref:effector-associated domain 2-containing protein n=1 Tax=Pseudofrankia asymbiotica TaxID=1834516 RepID=UPI00105659A6|nr:effector-associated domain EAD1-containing protein [Pseudofrankia asymbiotica]